MHATLNLKKQLSSEQFHHHVSHSSHDFEIDRNQSLAECGEYCLMESIGGYQGRVCKAVHKSKKHMTAIKQISLKPNCSAIPVEMVQNELLLYRSLSHPNLVQHITHIIENPPKLAIATEYLECKSARELLDDNTKFSESLVALFTHQILLGLKYLQEQGVVHGNLSASNVFVCSDGAVKLANFGVSFFLKEIAQMDEKLYYQSKAYWMAPESILLEGTTSAIDVWALGCVIIELLNSAPPFHQYSPPMAMYHIVGDLPLPIPMNISLRLRDFLLKCLQRDVGKRATIESLLTDPWITIHLDRLGKHEITKEIRWCVFDCKEPDPCRLKVKPRIMTPKRSDRGVQILAATGRGNSEHNPRPRPSFRHHSITHSQTQSQVTQKREEQVFLTLSQPSIRNPTRDRSDRTQADRSDRSDRGESRTSQRQKSSGSSVIARSYLHLPAANVSLEPPCSTFPYKLSYTPKHMQPRKKKDGPGRKLRKALSKAGHPLSQEETDRIVKQYYDVPESCDDVVQWASSLDKSIQANFAIGAILLANGFFDTLFELLDSLKVRKEVGLANAVRSLFQLLHTFMQKQDSVQSDFCMAGGVAVLVEWIPFPSVRVDLLRLLHQLLSSKNNVVLNSLLSCRIPKHLVNISSSLASNCNSEQISLVVSCLTQLMKAVDDREVFGNLIRTKGLLLDLSNLLVELWKSDNHSVMLEVADLMLFYFQTCDNLLDSFHVPESKNTSSDSYSGIANCVPFKRLMKVIGSMEIRGSDLNTMKCTCQVALTIKIVSMLVYLSIHPEFRLPLLNYGVPQKLVYFLSLHHLRDKLLDGSGVSYVDELIHKSLVVLTYLCRVHQSMQEAVLNVGIVKELVTLYKCYRHDKLPENARFAGSQRFRTLIIRILCLFPNNSEWARSLLWRHNIFKYYVAFLRDSRNFSFGLRALSLWIREEPDKVAEALLASEKAMKRLVGVLDFSWNQQVNDSFLSICRTPKILVRLCTSQILDSIANILKKNPAAATKLRFLQFLSALAQAAPVTYVTLGAFAKIQQLVTQFTLDQSMLVCQTATKLLQDIHQARSKLNVGPRAALTPPRSFLTDSNS